MIVALALAAAAAYGAADFLGGLASRRVATLAVVVWSQLTGLVILAASLPLLGGRAQPADLAWGAAYGLAGVFAIVLLYRGLAIGVMSVVSPVTAVLAATIPVAFSIALGARPSPLALGGIALALVAVVLVSRSAGGAEAARPSPAHRWPTGLPEALGAGIAFGFFFIAIAHTDRSAGAAPLLTARVVSLSLLALGARATHRTLRVPAASRPIVALSGALDMAANVLYLVAVQHGSLAIVAVLTSLYPASTVALAALVLHERLAPAQWAGVGCALAGVGLIAAG